MSELAGIIGNFCRLDGVQRAMVVGDDGAVVEEQVALGGERPPVIGPLRRSVELGQRLAEALGKGPLSQQHVEYGDSRLTTEVLEGGYLLVVLAESGANLGRIRLEIRKTRKMVEGLLT